MNTPTKKTWNATFYGKELGAIGAASYIVRTVDGWTKDEAILSLYDTHEHISQLTMEA